MDTVRWGIIGCGDVTEVKSGPALYKCENSELVAVMRRDGEKAANYARRHNVTRWYDDADRLIADDEVNAVYIATPPDSHCNYTQRIAAAGKAVYVEKPMAINHGDCQKMTAACTAAGVPLFVAYYRRRLPSFLKVKELMRSGAIGQPCFVTIHQVAPPSKHDLDPDNLPWRVIPEIAGNGYFFDLACHQLDALDYLLGPIATAKGNSGNQAKLYPSDDVVSASFAFESGVIGMGMWCFTTYVGASHDYTEVIVGNEGCISYSAFDLNLPVVLETNTGRREEFHLPPPKHVQQPLVQTVVDELLGRGKCPSTGHSASRTNRVLDQVIEA